MYYSARRIYRDGPTQRISTQNPKYCYLTWGEWFEQNYSEPLHRYIERAKADPDIGKRAMEYARKISESPATSKGKGLPAKDSGGMQLQPGDDNTSPHTEGRSSGDGAEATGLGGSLELF